MNSWKFSQTLMWLLYYGVRVAGTRSDSSPRECEHCSTDLGWPEPEVTHLHMRVSTEHWFKVAGTRSDLPPCECEPGSTELGWQEPEVTYLHVSLNIVALSEGGRNQKWLILTWVLSAVWRLADLALRMSLSAGLPWQYRIAKPLSFSRAVEITVSRGSVKPAFHKILKEMVMLHLSKFRVTHLCLWEVIGLGIFGGRKRRW